MSREQPKDPKVKSEQLRNFVFSKAWEYSQRRYNFEISDESYRNIERLNESLNDSSAIIYANHQKRDDLVAGASLFITNLPNARRFLAPAGMKHYDMRRDPINGILLRALRPLNIYPVPIVQVDDTYPYSENKIFELNMRFLRINKTFMGMPGTVCGIAPEGTRTDGTLIRANAGIGYLDQHSENPDYVPLAIVYPDEQHKSQLIVGEPLKVHDIVPDEISVPKRSRDRAQFLSDLHMRRLAEMLPEDMRGYYK